MTTILSGITAAVVGVILNLGIWFGLHALFGNVSEKQWHGVRLFIPQWETMNISMFAITAVACSVYFYLKWSMMKTMIATSACPTAAR